MLGQWEGLLAGCIHLDPGIAMIRWLEVRGDAPGPLFPELKSNNGLLAQLDFTERFSTSNFKKQLTFFLTGSGVAPDRAASFTSHCMKRGSIQLLRKLGFSDMEIMRRVFMTGVVSYLNYTENYKGFQADPIPEFSNIGAMSDFLEAKKEKESQDAAMANFLQSCSLSDLEGCMDLFPAVYTGLNEE